MAEVRGRKCDRQGCTTFLTDSPKRPPGWLAVTPTVDGEVVRDTGQSFEFCSDFCNAVWSIIRYEADTGKTFKRPQNISDEERRTRSERMKETRARMEADKEKK